MYNHMFVVLSVVLVHNQYKPVMFISVSKLANFRERNGGRSPLNGTIHSPVLYVMEGMNSAPIIIDPAIR